MCKTWYLQRAVAAEGTCRPQLMNASLQVGSLRRRNRGSEKSDRLLKMTQQVRRCRGSEELGGGWAPASHSPSLPYLLSMNNGVGLVYL